MTMKKTLALCLALAAAIALTACGGSAASSAAPAPSASAASSAGPEGQTYTVGICQLVQHEALDAATKGFRDALTEALGDAVAFEEQNASGDSANCATICSGFAANNVDLIMANATPALQAAVSATNAIPILGTSVTDYASALDISGWTGATGMNVSGTSDLAPLDGQAQMVKELFPDAKTVGILSCSGEANSAYQVATITPLLEGLGFTVKSFTFADSNDVAVVTETACGECDVLYIPTDNTAASCTEAIGNVVLNKKVPVVAGEVGICRGCGVATLSIDYYDLGLETGRMAAEVLQGADVSTMPVRYAPNFTKMYNAANCEALGVSVPADYAAVE